MCIHAVKHLDRNQKWNRFHCIYICDDVYISTTDTVFTKIQLKVSRLLFFFLYAMSLWILLSITGTFVNMCPGNIQKYFNYYNHNLLHFKIKRTNEDENPFTVFWLQLLCELFGQDVVILLTSKSMRKITCLNQRLCQGGGYGPSPDRMKSMVFRPQRVLSLEWLRSLSFLGHGKDGEDLFDNFYSSLLRKVRSYFLNYIYIVYRGYLETVKLLSSSFLV